MATYFGSFPGGTIFSADKWFASALFCFLTLLLGVFQLLALSAIGLTILRDTSEGVNVFANRPLGWITDWIEEASYVGISLFWGLSPALALLMVLPNKPALRLPICLFSEMILFPVFLLSALDSKSPVMFFSKPVWRSLWCAWHGWVFFYLYTILVGESFVYFWRVFPYKGMWTNIIAVSILLPVFWMVYFRLLGRLAYFCSGRFDEDIRRRRLGYRD